MDPTEVVTAVETIWHKEGGKDGRGITRAAIEEMVRWTTQITTDLEGMNGREKEGMRGILDRVGRLEQGAGAAELASAIEGGWWDSTLQWDRREKRDATTTVIIREDTNINAGDHSNTGTAEGDEPIHTEVTTPATVHGQKKGETHVTRAVIEGMVRWVTQIDTVEEGMGDRETAGVQGIMTRVDGLDGEATLMDLTTAIECGWWHGTKQFDNGKAGSDTQRQDTVRMRMRFRRIAYLEPSGYRYRRRPLPLSL